MKALSLQQPWASLMAVGLKHIETRSRPLRYRGPLVIHASGRWRPDVRRAMEAAWQESPVGDAWRAIARALAATGLPSIGDLPLGAALGIVVVRGCYPTEHVRETISTTERAFGDYSDGRFAITTTFHALFPCPIPFKGRLSPWMFPDHLVPVESGYVYS